MARSHLRLVSLSPPLPSVHRQRNVRSAPPTWPTAPSAPPPAPPPPPSPSPPRRAVSRAPAPPAAPRPPPCAARAPRWASAPASRGASRRVGACGTCRRRRWDARLGGRGAGVCFRGGEGRRLGAWVRWRGVVRLMEGRGCHSGRLWRVVMRALGGCRCLCLCFLRQGWACDCFRRLARLCASLRERSETYGSVIFAILAAVDCSIGMEMEIGELSISISISRREAVRL